MRSFLSASLALAASAYTAAAAHTPPTRKSLSFGPVHPHKRFDVDPSQLATFSAYHDPLEFARAYVSDLNRDLDNRHSFIVREDSYTDDRTGVSHVYVRQLVNGVEVADGNINLNIKDGRVLSYGDSFYRGPSPAVGVDPASDKAHSQSTYCSRLENELQARQEHLNALVSNDQVVLGNDKVVELQRAIRPIAALFTHNCADQYSAADLHKSGDIADPKKAALMFMITAHPSNAFSDKIRATFDEQLKAITSTFEPHLTGGEGQHMAPIEVMHNVPGTVGPVRSRLAYVQTAADDHSTTLNLVWKMEVEMQDNWYEAAISVSDPSRIVEVVDWASDSGVPVEEDKIPETSYNVWKFGLNDPESGKRSIEKNAHDKAASPLGWHTLPLSKDPLSKGVRSRKANQLINYSTTWGNNVFAHEDWEGRSNWINNYRPDAGASGEFDYEYSLKTKNGSWIDPRAYVNLTVTQLFYTANVFHDLLYRYGFDEKSGNFQQHNFGKGGAENDAVIANAQDGSGYNNANFMTPPDGTNGRCRMYIWNVHGAPYRDGDLEAGIVIHEYSHGLSTRLTGGPKDSGCLGWGESGGMGEGWGDFLATTIRSTSTYSDFSMGSWAANETKGIRNYIYSTDIVTNPSTYRTIDNYWGVHAIGEVWAEILFVVSNKLIEKHGYSDTLFPPTPNEDGSIPEGDFYRPAELTPKGEKKALIPKHGNSLIVQLVIDGMKLQPCRPSFFDARDAIIQADEILTGGENLCTLWEGFSERGLGPKASVKGATPWGGGIRTNDFKVPKVCNHVEPEPEEPTPEEPTPEEPTPEEPEPEEPEPEEPGEEEA